MKPVAITSVFASLALLAAGFWPRRAKAGDGLTLGADVIDFGETMDTNQLPDTRGFRNNNPGNIEYSEHNPWVGQTGDDGRYAIFSDMKYGIRALGKLIRNYQKIRGLSTIREIITRYAPPRKSGRKENDTVAYISHVSQFTGLQADEPINLDGRKELETLVGAIIKHENGHELPFSQIAEGLELM